jgi:hypothetical protein
MNCGLRHFRDDVMQVTYRHSSICANFLLFPEEGRERSKMAYQSFVRHEHQSFLQRIHGTTSPHFADS